MREPISDNLRRRVFQRYGKKCRYCGKTDGSFHIDHVYPVVKGGETTLENLVVACKGCNLSKHSRVGIWPKPIGYFDYPVKRGKEIVIRLPDFNFIAHSYGVFLMCSSMFLTVLFFVLKSDSMFVNEHSIDPLLVIGLSMSVMGLLVSDGLSLLKGIYRVLSGRI